MTAYRTDLLVIGRGRSTRYLARREVFDLGRSLPIFEIRKDGSARRLATLHAVLPRAFYVDALTGDIESRVFEDLPYFLADLRPAGFLGRLVPRRHPELNLPADVRHWTADQTLSYLARHGWNLPGNLIVGEDAFRKHLEQTAQPLDQVGDSDRATRYPELADNVLAWGTPGSSAGGEQPKFLLTRIPSETAALVKFSPPVRDTTSRRIADLLVSEHLALERIRLAGHEAPRTELIHAGGRVFLEVERFDRLAGGGRRGLITMEALDAEFVGHGTSWPDSAAALAEQGHLDAATVAEIRWRHSFGRLIANTDMHMANLSFFSSGTRVLGIAPTYDMGPALYAPTAGHMYELPLSVPTPDPYEASIWDSACAEAHGFWATVADHSDISAEFRAIARSNAEIVIRAKSISRLLPDSA